jgi:oligopeptide transport system ATP-binding protein
VIPAPACLLLMPNSVPLLKRVFQFCRGLARALRKQSSAADLPSGCRFHPRCPRARIIAARGGETIAATGTRLPQACVTEDPALTPCDSSGHFSACHFPEED